MRTFLNLTGIACESPVSNSSSGNRVESLAIAQGALRSRQGYHYGKRRRSVVPGDSCCGGQSMLKSRPLEGFYRGSCRGALILQWLAESYLDYETISEAGEPD